MQILHIKPKQPAQETPSLPLDQQHSDHFVTVGKYSLDDPFSDTDRYFGKMPPPQSASSQKKHYYQEFCRFFVLCMSCLF